jgi:hypothetical protein
VVETELMPRLVGGDAEMVCSKLKRGNRFSKPNFGVGPNLVAAAVEPLGKSRKSCGQTIC